MVSLVHARLAEIRVAKTVRLRPKSVPVAVCSMESWKLHYAAVAKPFTCHVGRSAQLKHKSASATYTSTTTSSLPNYSPSLKFDSVMSEKLKEFVEIPQEFIKDGQQVCLQLVCFMQVFSLDVFPQFLTRCTKPSQKGACSLIILLVQ